MTLEQLQALRNEAAQHGDLEQVWLCDLAMNGDEKAMEDCARVLSDAKAQG